MIAKNTHYILLISAVCLSTSTTSKGQQVPSTDQAEVYDVMMTDGEVNLGLVRVRKNNEEYCVVVYDVKMSLGYPQNQEKAACLTLTDLFKEQGIPLTLNLARVELRLDSEYSYPAKDFKLAKARIDKISTEMNQPMFTLSGYRASILPEFRRIDLELMTHNQFSRPPDIQTMMSGDVLRGSYTISGLAVNKASTNTYEIRSTDFRWLWKPNNGNTSSPHVEIGTALSNEHTPPVKGIKFSNKPLSSREFNSSAFVRLDLPTGSIVEWAHQSGANGGSVLDDTWFKGIEAPIGYGLNKLTYSITKPGEVTSLKEHWIRVPYQMLPKGKFEYQGTIGSIEMFDGSSVFASSIDYGISNRISVGAEQVALMMDGTLKNRGSARLAWTPSYTSELTGYLGSDSNYHVAASYWNPRFGSIDVSDSRESSFVYQNYRPNRRHSMLRASANGNRQMRYQVAYSRSEYEDATGNAVEGIVNTSFHKWFLTASVNHRWWKNTLIRSSGYTSANWNIGHRLNNRLMLTADVYASVVDQVQIESLRLSSHYHTGSVQLGGSVSMHTPFQTVQLNVHARVTTDWITLASRNDIHGAKHHGSQFLSTSWMKSRPNEWHPSSQTSQGSSGFTLIPFHDKNGNGVKDSNEMELSGLMGSIRDGRLIDLNKSDDRLVFGGLQPHRTYTISLESDLRNEPDYLVQLTRVKVESPGSGYRLINVPAVKSIECSGIWELTDGASIKLGYTDLLFIKNDGSSSVRGTMFSDGTWTIDKIAAGLYEIKVISGGKDAFVTNPSFIHIGSTSTLENPKISIMPKS